MAVREILAATDFSELGDAAVALAREYAASLGARVHLIHVASAADRAISGLLEQLAEPRGQTVPVLVATIAGDPAERIVEYARSRGVDLIVIGTHGRHGFTRRPLGGVADKVLRQAPCPVLAVPEQTPESPRAPAA
jgi:nucleotide-binding universal stress UspA family protein